VLQNFFWEGFQWLIAFGGRSEGHIFKRCHGQLFFDPRVTVAERSKAPDWVMRSKVVGSNPQPWRQFFNLVFAKQIGQDLQ